MNFTFQDLLGSTLAFLVFPSILLFPGYVISWLFDLFDFKQRQILTRYLIATVISMAGIPILVYLLSLLTSFEVTKLILVLFFISYILIVVVEHIKLTKSAISFSGSTRYQNLAFFIAVGWVAFTIMSLVDFQFGDRLYNNAVSLDFATRATMVNAITRTGVPPVNPSFFPGHPEYTTSVYYFWYILCSIIDQFGGAFVDSRMALIAGDAWGGLALMALIALYLKFRNSIADIKAWQTAISGIGLLAISGLDAVPALTNMLVTRFAFGYIWPPGDIEHWNEQITAWIGALLWVPHHVAAMIACLTGLMIFQYYQKSHRRRSIATVLIAGLAFASAVGLSTWVTITFSLFLGAWGIILLVRSNDRQLITLMGFAGLVALLFASPFLLGIIKGGTGASGALPVAVEVRRFFPIGPYMAGLPTISKNIIYFLLLPINYLMELGFFLVVGLIWLRKYWRKEIPANPFLLSELVLLCVVFLVCSFIKSAIFANDLGWRGWLLGQFVLLIWAVDLYQEFPVFNHNGLIKIGADSPKARTAKLLAFLWLIGLSTSVVDVALLRFFPLLVDVNVTGFPNRLSPDTRLGERTFDSRLAYEFINDELPVSVVIQQNPLSEIDYIDRPSGLYGNRQFAISYNAAYNVPHSVLEMKLNEISKIFALAHENSWDKIDLLCRDHFIDVLVVSDQDALWKNLPHLYQQRTALYKNRYYAVIACGNFISHGDYP